MELDRRDFLKGAALAGATVAGSAMIAAPAFAVGSGSASASGSVSESASASGSASGLASNSASTSGSASGSTAASESISGAASSWLPAKWDKEADVVVIGMGQTGCTCALRAADKGDSVIILEKETADEAGGDLSINAGFADLGFRGGVDMTVGEVECGSAWYLSEDEANEYLKYEQEFQNVLDEIGAVEVHWDAVTEPHYYIQIPDDPQSLGNSGWYWYQCYVNTIQGRTDQIEVDYETPGLALVQNPVTREVLGVKAGSADAPIYIKANKGVYVATGGYENDPELFKGMFAAGLYVPICGHPAITGDGLKMCVSAGAKFTHVHSAVEYVNACFKKASQDAGTAIPMGQGVGGDNAFANGYIIVNRFGERFCDETKSWMHNHSTPDRWFDIDGEWFGSTDSIGWHNSPAWLICDQAELDSGAFGRRRGNGGWGYNTSNPNRPCAYEWSEDNQKEVENGYILKADTLEELCALLTDVAPNGQTVSPDPDATKAALQAYNESCKNGIDDGYGRTADTMATISEDGPFYGAAMAMGAIYTTGGVNTTVRSEVVDWSGNPIPRLYAGGDCASPFVFRTPASHYAVASGVAAAEGISALKPWA